MFHFHSPVKYQTDTWVFFQLTAITPTYCHNWWHFYSPNLSSSSLFNDTIVIPNTERTKSVRQPTATYTLLSYYSSMQDATKTCSLSLPAPFLSCR